MDNNKNRAQQESTQFLRDVAAVAAHSKNYVDGVDLVDRHEFWKWFTSDVVKRGNIDGEKVPLVGRDQIKAWVQHQIDSDGRDSLKTLFQGRAAEFDFVQRRKNSLLELVKGNQWHLAPAEMDAQGVDVIRRRLLSGEEETHQLKAGLSDSYKRANLSRYMEDGGQPADVVQVNQRIMDWRDSPSGQNTIAQRGDAHQDVRMLMSDEQMLAGRDLRIDQALSGDAVVDLGAADLLGPVTEASLTGAAIVIGVKTMRSFAALRRGELSREEFAKEVASESAPVALQGGIVAAVSMGVQLSPLAPVTIPVMILVGYGARQVVAPMFGRGGYAEQLHDIQVTTDIVDGYSNFMYACTVALENRQQLAKYLAEYQARSAALDEISEVNIERIRQILERGQGDE